MKIKTENLSGKHYYSDMQLSERNFLTFRGSMSYEHGEYHFLWLPRCNKVHGYIGFDMDGKLFFRPIIRTKDGKAKLSEKELIKLFEDIVSFVHAAGENGFIDFEDGKE